MGMYSRVGGSLTRPGEQKKAVKHSSSRAQAPVKQQTRYESLKAEIRIWWTERSRILEALQEIHDTKMYLEEYDTFEDFCISELAIGRAHAYRLLKAAEVKDSVKNVSIGDKLTNEAQARALAAVPEEQREEVLTHVAESGPVTAKRITEAAQDNEHETSESESEEAPPHQVTCPACGGLGWVDG